MLFGGAGCGQVCSRKFCPNYSQLTVLQVDSGSSVIQCDQVGDFLQFGKFSKLECSRSHPNYKPHVVRRSKVIYTKLTNTNYHLSFGKLLKT